VQSRRASVVSVVSGSPCGQPVGEGDSRRYGGIEIATYSTPGHAAAHNCYLVRSVGMPSGRALLISGDLIFAGSVGGAFYCAEQLQANLCRMLQTVPPQTMIAPGHGPLTTVENELKYNPFVV
jgi:glyoxylase-like metal-dependent hydrolase (beta-lactamase superfamily II)